MHAFGAQITDKPVDVFVHAVGTAHSIHGATAALCEHDANIRVVAVEPAVLSGSPTDDPAARTRRGNLRWYLNRCQRYCCFESRKPTPKQRHRSDNRGGLRTSLPEHRTLQFRLSGARCWCFSGLNGRSRGGGDWRIGAETFSAFGF